MEQEILNLVNKQVQQAIVNALTCLIQTSSSNRLSNNNQKVSFHNNTISNCSLSTIKNDLICYQTSGNMNNNNRSNRTSDVQYSYSLNQPWLTKFNEQQYDFTNIQNYVDELIQHSIQTVLLELDDENLTVEDERSCSWTTRQAINPYIERFIQSIVKQTIEFIASSNTEQVAKDIIDCALSDIANDAKYFQNTTKNLLPSEDNEQFMDSFMNNITKQIYMNSFNELRQILTNDNNGN